MKPGRSAVFLPCKEIKPANSSLSNDYLSALVGILGWLIVCNSPELSIWLLKHLRGISRFSLNITFEKSYVLLKSNLRAYCSKKNDRDTFSYETPWAYY